MISGDENVDKLVDELVAVIDSLFIVAEGQRANLQKRFNGLIRHALYPGEPPLWAYTRADDPHDEYNRRAAARNYYMADQQPGESYADMLFRQAEGRLFADHGYDIMEAIRAGVI